MTQVHAKIAQQRFELDAVEIERRLRDVLPEPLGDHFVVMAGKRFPLKQVIGLVTGLDRADFNGAGGVLPLVRRPLAGRDPRDRDPSR